MIRAAKRRHPKLHFICADAHAVGLAEKFDVIICSDLLNDLWDVQTVLQQISELTNARSRIIINSYQPVVGAIA